MSLTLTAAGGELPPRHRSRRDRARWCGGKVGREHHYRVTTPRNQPGWMGQCRGLFAWEVAARAARSWLRYLPEWHCNHARVCSACGRVAFQRVAPESCPTYRLRRLAGTLPAQGEPDLVLATD